MRVRHLALGLPALLLAGCAMGPNYKRPDTPLPGQFRGAPRTSTAVSLADTKWSELFHDDTLRQLIETALEHNFDLGMASERVSQARARFGIVHANELPYIAAQGNFTAVRPSTTGSTFVPEGTTLDVSFTQAAGFLSWELDLWGRLRRLSESARAQYLATEEARRGVVVSLIGDVSSAYFLLRERDLELEIARRTRSIAEDNLRLVRLRKERGAANGLDVQQAEQFLYIATSQIASAERDIGQAEDALNLLLGKVPSDIVRPKSVDDIGLPPEVPAGLPSSLLERRPDIRAAEQALISANAQIGAAKAQYFPSISLTGFLGGQSRALSDLFTGPARLGNITPISVLPLFDAGQIRNSVRLSEAQKREMILAYQKAIYNGMREVSDALIGYDRTREQRKQQELLVRALSESTRLSTLRYRGGLDSYLQVLDSERNLFEGELAQARLRLSEIVSFVQLYRALGGGWQ